YAPGQSRDTAPLGSPGYAAPEQYGKAQTTIQTDIYGLGATLQTLLTGQEPTLINRPQRKKLFQGKSRLQLQQLLRQMLELDARLRPQTIEEVRKQLQQLFAKDSARRRFFRCLFITIRESIADALLFTLVLSMFFVILLVQIPWLLLPIYGSFYLMLLLIRLFISLRMDD